MPQIRSSYRELALGKKDKKKMPFRVSNFLITMNTNVRFTEATGIEEWAPGLYQMGERLFGDSDRVGRFVTFPEGGAWDARHIVSVDSTMKVEVGHNACGQRLHLHANVKIRHKSYIRLDIPRIQIEANDFLSEMAYPFPIHHLHVKTGKPTFEDYLDEGVEGGEDGEAEDETEAPQV